MKPTLKQRLNLEPPPELPEDPGPEPRRPAPQFKRYEYSHRNPVTGITNVQPIIHYKLVNPENPSHFPNLPWVEKLYRSHAERIWAAERWRAKEEQLIKEEKLAKEKGVVGRLLSGIDQEEVDNVELTEEDISTEALIRRASVQKHHLDKPILKDAHRRREERAKELEENIQQTKRQREELQAAGELKRQK
jgi:hypothetical protein